MFKSYLPIVIAVLMLVSLIFWFVSANYNIPTGEIVQFGVIFVLIGFGVYFGINRIRSRARKEPMDDELSKKIMQKAAAISYFASLYLWLVIMYITTEGKHNVEVMFGWGILGMAVIFLISWVVIRIIGIKNE